MDNKGHLYKMANLQDGRMNEYISWRSRFGCPDSTTCPFSITKTLENKTEVKKKITSFPQREVGE